MTDTWRRRDVLRVLGSMAATAALPIRLRAADPPSAIMTTLSTYMSEARNRSLPQEAVEKTKDAIIDTLAAMISGSQLPPGKFALKFAGLYKGQNVATVEIGRAHV